MITSAVLKLNVLFQLSLKHLQYTFSNDLCDNMVSLRCHVHVSVSVTVPSHACDCPCHCKSHSKMCPRNKTLGATVIAWPFSIQQFCFEIGKKKGPKRRDGKVAAKVPHHYILALNGRSMMLVLPALCSA